MWTDNETAQDFLNFGSVARTVAEVIEQAHSRPISIGVSGAWGVGKSSMIKLIRGELDARAKCAGEPTRMRAVPSPSSSSLNSMRGSIRAMTTPVLR